MLRLHLLVGPLWFDSYSEERVVLEDCQDRGVNIENSSGVWIYALATKAIKEIVSPVKMPATLAANQNGYLSFILAWLEGSTAVIGNHFPGWTIFPEGSLANIGLNKACEAAMYQSLKCDTSAQALLSDGYQGNIGNATRLSLMCDPGCAASLRYLHYLQHRFSLRRDAKPHARVAAWVWPIWSGLIEMTPASRTQLRLVL